ncbi:MAG: hypothetical protein ABIT01_13920 [Thermoanaerobaculia bacterium]
MRQLVAVLTLGATAFLSGRLEAADSHAASRPSRLVEAAAFSPQSGETPIGKIETLSATASVSVGPIPIGVEADVYCTGWLGELEEPFTGDISSAELQDNQKSFTQGDLVYLNIGAQNGVNAGQEYWICRPERLVHKWDDPAVDIGRIYRTPGRLRVICAQEDAAIAEIVLSCSDIEIGDRLLPFEPVPIPLARRTRPMTSCDGPNGKAEGHIVEVKDYQTPAATDSVVFLDMGENEGLSAGDFMTVYRPRATGSIRTILGEVSILATRSHTSIAIVTLTVDSMRAGDWVELK